MDILLLRYHCSQKTELRIISLSTKLCTHTTYIFINVSIYLNRYCEIYPSRLHEFTLIPLIPVTPQNKAQLSLFHMLICDSCPMVRNLILVKKNFFVVVTYLFNPRMHVKPFWEPKLMLFSLVWICAFRKGLSLFVRSLPALLPITDFPS